MKFLTNSAVAIAVYLSLSHAYAVDLDAGDYDYAPTGTNLAILYYQHATRDALYSGSDKVPGDYSLTSDVGIARYVHYTDIAGIHVAPQILIPFGRLDAGKDISDLGSSSGLGDIILANTFFFYNNASTHSTFGITPYLFLPTGQYSSDKALNLGENRYKLNIQAAYTTRLTPKLAWDVSADMTIYGKNTDAIGGDKKQDIGYQVQTNARYFLNDKVDLRAGLSYSDAGDTKQAGVTTNGTQQTKFWLGTGINPTPTTQVIVAYGRDLKVENGFKEDNRINLRFLKAF
ncbi:transporter [Acinetobacter sp. ANC 3791]|uniref:transporter n=1 Tax=Acinetobacter sp. ANC 3791 TaxID=2529836 RepID=UPI00103E9881|nr:transporter [Acinetobacter sp. ANC 3791]TCB83608.1 transporter [Acinetobacter sp. ANC 3791]